MCIASLYIYCIRFCGKLVDNTEMQHLPKVHVTIISEMDLPLLVYFGVTYALVSVLPEGQLKMVNKHGKIASNPRKNAVIHVRYAVNVSEIVRRCDCEHELLQSKIAQTVHGVEA